MAGYYNSNYWNANYWHANYWAPAGSISGDYWNDRYWNANYWNTNYWLEVNDGDVNQISAPQLSLNGFIATVGIGLNAEADTEALSLATFQAAVANDIDPAITTASLTLTGYNVAAGFAGYQLGDITLRWFPDSAFSVTFGVVASTPSLSLSPMVHTIEDGSNINVACSLATLSLNTLVSNARLDVNPEPLPASLVLNGLNTTAGIGQQAQASLGVLTFNAPTHTVVGFPGITEADVTLETLVLAAFNPVVSAQITPTIPESSFGDYGALIVNSEAIEYPSFYDIDERTGFRVKPGTLVEEWNGTKVRPQSFEARHPQDFVKSKADEIAGSERPEQEDKFIGTDVPEVTAADL